MTSLVTYPIDALISYHYYREPTQIAKVMRFQQGGVTRFIGDSGAFSAYQIGATIELSTYAMWCRTWWDHFCWCASLDVIGDPQASWTNWTRLRDRHQLLTVPTLHAGCGTRWLDAYAKEGADLIGLGGMAGSGQAPRAFRWAVHMVRHARDHWPQVRFHLWGVTGHNFLETLPVWSADSSGLFLQAAKFGALRLFDPARGINRVASLRGGGVYKLAALLRCEYGVDPETINRSHSGNRELLMRLQISSAQRYARFLQKRHLVSPPSMFRDVATASLRGPRLHIVDDTFRALNPMITEMRPDTEIEK